MRLFSIDTGLFKLDGGAMFGTIPKTLWSRVCQADDNNLCTLAMRCLLIETGDRLILIDTGIGSKQPEKFFSYYFLHGDDSLEKSLNIQGFTPEDITDVILSHLHLDHAGGALKSTGDTIVPAFPNALYWSCKEHWDWAVSPNERERPSFLKENILPLETSGQLRFIEKTDKCVDFMKDVRIRFVSGHTESMMLPMINYKNRTLVFVADLLPGAAHIPINYVPAYDIDPLQTMEEKKAFLAEAERNNYVLFFEHDPEVECCTLRQTEKGIRIDRTFKLEDL